MKLYVPIHPNRKVLIKSAVPAKSDMAKSNSVVKKNQKLFIKVTK